MNPSSTKAKGLWLCLHFNQLPLEIFSRGQSAIGQLAIDSALEKPMVVVVRQRIHFMNPAAKNMGIRSGSSMDTAYTLSSQIVSFERDEAKELTTLSHLAQWAYQFTPGVSIKTPHSLLLEVASCLKLYGSLPELISIIREGLGKLGFSANIGVNHTPLAALCLAEQGFSKQGLAEQNGSAVLTGDGINRLVSVPASLKTTPIDCLLIEPKVKESLQQMGIKNIGSLLDLPIDGLNRRFGIFFTDYLQRLIGEKPDPQKFISETPRFYSDITFLSDVTNIQSLVFPVKRLISELCQFLLARQLCINHLTFRLSHRSHEPKSFSIYLANPDNDANMFLMLIQLQLDKINDVPEIDNICLIVNTFYPADSTSGDLFHNSRFRPKSGDGRNSSPKNSLPIKNAEQDRANRLLNMLRVRLGPGNCFGLSLANDHRPEKAWKTINLGQKNYWHPENEKGENPRPLYLLNSQKKLSVRNRLPCLGGQLELTQGPERIDFGWWDGNDSARDYYIGRHECGVLYWVFHHLKNDNWYLHGIFS
ncbi:MAG: DNA polymerase Y family protein [Pseudomonadales bacterium]|jgi:protein ImuB